MIQPASLVLMSKSAFKSLARWAVAAALLYWLFKSGKLDGLQNLPRLLLSPWLFATAAVFLALNYVLNFFRWQILLKGAHIKVPFSEVVRLSMVGQFFSIVMPGAVGGDVIKAIYIAKEFPEHKTNGIASILLDRILGFLTLMLFASLFFLLSFSNSEVPPALQGFGTLLSLGTAVLFLCVLLPKRVAALIGKFGLEHPIFLRIKKTLSAFGRSRYELFMGLFFSFLSQGCAIFGMFMLGDIVYGALPWGDMDAFRFVSATAVGTTASAIPLSPMGLGIGQIAFAKVFKLLGAPTEGHGIVIISAAQIISFCLNLSGAFWFLRSKKVVTHAE